MVVIDWTVTGEPPPTGTRPTITCRVCRLSNIEPSLGPDRGAARRPPPIIPGGPTDYRLIGLAMSNHRAPMPNTARRKTTR